MMRIIESVHQINHALTENGTDAGAVTTEMLEQWARDSYVTGVLLLDENGKVQVQYGDPVDGLSTEELSEHMTSDALQDAILFSEKTYAMRFTVKTVLMQIWQLREMQMAVGWLSLTITRR